MSDLGDLLIQQSEQLVQRWYVRWQTEGPAMPELTEAAIKDHLGVQLRVIGEALREEGGATESPRQLWEQPGRSDPEQRVRDDVPIEEVVREYGFVLDELRGWIAEQPGTFSFAEISYLYIAVFELAAESARRYAEFAAAEVKRARSEYVASVAHQLRTPVSVLRLMTQRAAQRGAHLGPAELERLSRTVDRLGRLVDSLGRVERFEPEETPVLPVRLCPAEVVDELVAAYERDAIRKGLRLDVVVDRSASMVADPDLLVDALGNLVENAIKYTQHGFVRIVVEDEEEQVSFRVEDSGPGIPAERQRGLFEPKHPGMGGGMGLGLAIADRAARAQGGSIEARSEPGQGSTFILRLPREVPARDAGAHGAPG